MTADDAKQAVFGSFDGLTSCLGVVTGLIVAGTHSGPRILAGALGLAVAATIGMGAGEFLSDVKRSYRRAAVMAAATFAGSALPAVPFSTGYGARQVVIALLLTAAAAGVIGYYRGYLLTLGLLVVVAALTAGLSALVA